MKLIKKGTGSSIHTKVWCEEVKNKVVSQRKLFTCYDISLPEIEALLLTKLEEK